MRISIYIYADSTGRYQVHIDDGSIDRLLTGDQAIKYIASLPYDIACQCRDTYNAMLYSHMNRQLQNAYH